MEAIPEALERAIIERPDDLAAHLVYADWLEERGDPRGELISVQVALARAPDAPEAPLLRARAEELIARHEAAWTGGAAAHDSLSVRWERGFVDAIEVLDTNAVPSLARLLTLPAARLTRSITHAIWEAPGALVALLSASPPPALRALSLGQCHPGFDWSEDEIELGELSSLWAALPRLEELELAGTPWDLGAIELPQLRALSWTTLGPRAPVLQGFVETSWPALESLTLWFSGGGHNPGAIARLLDGDGLPRLRHLGLRGNALPESLRDRLPRARLLPRLASLDLSGGWKHPDDKAALARLSRDPAFAHLTALRV